MLSMLVFRRFPYARTSVGLTTLSSSPMGCLLREPTSRGYGRPPRTSTGTTPPRPADERCGATDKNDAMELLVRIRWRHASPADLRCDVEGYHTVADLLAAASSFCAAPWEPSQPVFLQRSGAQLALGASILQCAVVSGDTLRFELYGAEADATPVRAESISCDVTAGPEAGRSFVLEPGKHEVGRGSECEVALDDATVSRHQLSIAVFPDLTAQLIPDDG